MPAAWAEKRYRAGVALTGMTARWVCWSDVDAMETIEELMFWCLFCK